MHVTMNAEELNQVVSYFENFITAQNPSLNEVPSQVHHCKLRLPEFGHAMLTKQVYPTGLRDVANAHEAPAFIKRTISQSVT